MTKDELDQGLNPNDPLLQPPPTVQSHRGLRPIVWIVAIAFVVLTGLGVLTFRYSYDSSQALDRTEQALALQKETQDLAVCRGKFNADKDDANSQVAQANSTLAKANTAQTQAQSEILALLPAALLALEADDQAALQELLVQGQHLATEVTATRAITEQASQAVDVALAAQTSANDAYRAAYTLSGEDPAAFLEQCASKK